MPTRITTQDGLSNPQYHVVQDNVEEVVTEVNAAEGSGDQFIVVTDNEGKKLSIRVKDVKEIREQ